MDKNKLREFFANNLGFIAVFFISAIYILSAILTVDKTGRTISQILWTGSIGLILGFLISKTLNLQGLILGSKDTRVVETQICHARKVNDVSPYFDLLDEWCERQNKLNYKTQRTRILSKVGLKYDDCFDEDGNALPYKPNNNLMYKNKKLNKLRKKAYNKAIRLELTPLTSSNLTSTSGKTEDIFNFGRTKLEYEKESSMASIFTRVCTAVIFGYYGVKTVENFSWASLLWTGFQVATYIAVGVLSMYSSYMYVTD